MPKHIRTDHCCGVILDVQDYFMGQLERSRPPRIRANTKNYVRLLAYFRIPIVVTLERPVDHKGSLPHEINEHLDDVAHTFQKDRFDLTREQQIRNHLAGLKRKQVIVAGCETDVCVLQSCLGLLSLGYEVYMVEDLLFSSSRNVDAAIERMKDAGGIFLTYKSLYYELIDAVEGGREKIRATFGPFPRDLPDYAE